MKPIFIYYQKCSTCRRAIKFLKQHNIEVEYRDLMEDNPTKEELTQWFAMSEYPIKRLFNTFGTVYREMDLKTKLKTMSDDEALELLSTTGRLIRRPVLVSDQGVFFGFHEDMYETLRK